MVVAVVVVVVVEVNELYGWGVWRLIGCRCGCECGCECG